MQRLIGVQLDALGFLALLQSPHLRIRAAALEQHAMGAAFDDATVVHYQNLVGIDHRGQAMRDDQRRAILRDAVELGLNCLLGARIERRGRFVEDEDLGILQDRARDGHALLLAARQLEAALADHRVVAVGQTLDEIVDMRRSRCLDDLIGRSFRPAIVDVVENGVVEQHGILRHDAEIAAQAALRDRAQILPVDRDTAAADIVEAKQQA